MLRKHFFIMKISYIFKIDKIKVIDDIKLISYDLISNGNISSRAELKEYHIEKYIILFNKWKFKI